jgi:ubiquinol-cytochrome c reductase cytochrome b subunit
MTWNHRFPPRGPVLRRIADATGEIDERFHPASNVRKIANKVFPDHFSFLLGEIALYSFVVLVLSGTYLALWFDPSMAEVTYHGVFTSLRGVDVSRAYASTLDISFEVRGGLFARQIHHWAALLFVAAMTIHMLRIFFTGAFRKPRDINWVIGVSLLMLGIFEGFMGYSLGDDLLSGMGLRIAASILLSIPVIGTWLEWLVFGGEYPGHLIIPRMFAAHVLIVPGVIAALIAVHLAFVWFQKHTQFPGPGRTERNVVGSRLMPVFSLHSVSLAVSVFGLLCLLGGLAQINPVWNYGPYNPAQGSVNAQPDWYMGFVEGALRLFPPWTLDFGGRYIVPAQFWPSVVLPVFMVGMMLAYPFAERRLSGDRRLHNLLQRPRDNPIRTGIGMMGLTFFVMLFLAGGDDVIGYWLKVPIEELVWIGRIGVFVLPMLAFFLTHRVCVRLQGSDRDVLEHGVRTGVVVRRPSGTYVLVRQPLRGRDSDGGTTTLTYDGAPVPKDVDVAALTAVVPDRQDRDGDPSA